MAHAKTGAPTIVLGTNGPWWNRKKVRLSGHDISLHKHIIGLTGQGKSKLLASIYVQLLQSGVPAALIDPHSDLADDVLGMLRDQHLLNDRFLYIDFGRKDRFLPFNILKTGYDPHHTARQVVETFKRVWPALAAGAAPAFENILLHGTYVLIENQRPLTDLAMLIENKRFRDMLLAQCADFRVVSFWRDYFDGLPERDRIEEVQSSLRRVSLLTFDLTIRYSLGQPDNALDFRQLMDEGISVVFNLGGLDEETQRFLGCLLTIGYETAALARADTPVWERTPYHLLMDEFSMFSATSEDGLARILSLARKYNLSLGMAHQTFSQTSERIRGALGNAMRIAFKLQPDDAAWMAQQLGEYDPFEIKHMVEDEGAQGRSHPVFYTVAEAYERLKTQLKILAPRQAIVKTDHGFAAFTTLEVPPTKTTRRQLGQLKESFAQRLLTSRARAVELVDESAFAEEEGPPPA